MDVFTKNLQEANCIIEIGKDQKVLANRQVKRLGDQKVFAEHQYKKLQEKLTDKEISLNKAVIEKQELLVAIEQIQQTYQRMLNGLKVKINQHRGPFN